MSARAKKGGLRAASQGKHKDQAMELLGPGTEGDNSAVASLIEGGAPSRDQLFDAATAGPSDDLPFLSQLEQAFGVSLDGVEAHVGGADTEAALHATEEAPAALAYTRYVLEAGYSGDFLDLMAALAPCVLGYGEIGARLAGSTGPYADWCATYGGQDYQALCRDVGALIDGALIHRLGADWPNLPRAQSLAARFATATRLEVGFWDMGLRPA